MVRRVTMLILVAPLIFLCGQTLAVDAVSVSKIDGFDSTTGGLMANTPIRFYINYEVGEFDLVGFGNSYHIYSPDGAIWQPIFAIPTVMLSSLFDFAAVFLEFGVDGLGADTLDLFAINNNGPGLVAGFNNNLFYIGTSISDSQIGKSLCLDTASRVCCGPFLWSTTGGVVAPAWSGGGCFEIVDCCSGNRGDVNGDGVGPNIIDLTTLVDFLFRGSSAPDCYLESDVNGDGMSINILDLIFVVDFIHRGGPPAPACPN